MARPKQFAERILISMIEGTIAKIDALLQKDEYRLDFIRSAIEAEIAKRSIERAGRMKTPSDGPPQSKSTESR